MGTELKGRWETKKKEKTANRRDEKEQPFRFSARCQIENRCFALDSTAWKLLLGLKGTKHSRVHLHEKLLFPHDSSLVQCRSETFK